MDPATPAASRALELRGISKRFGPVQALDRVDLDVSAGTVHALLGENGAGKSTLMRIAYGLERRDSGDVRVFGKTLSGHAVADANAAGIGMVHQHLSLSPALTAVENLVLGGAGLYDPAAAEQRLRAVSQDSGLSVPPHARVADLSIVEQQRLEILKALARKARVLILDEPTAVLAPAEIADLLGWMRRFADAGGAIVFVTHKLREALAAADDVTVLRRGNVAFRTAARAVSADDLARAMFPERQIAVDSPDRRTDSAIVVRAERAGVRDTRGVVRVRDATFEIRHGDIAGVAGVEGSGVRDLLQALAGIARVSSGVLRLPERVGFIPADRQHDALVPEFTIMENIALHGAGHRRGLMPWRALTERTNALLDEYAVSPRSPAALARTLSGGNQQRVVVGRELAGGPDLLVADNPTRGLDIHASAFVLQRLVRSAAAGVAVVIHSSDLDEALSVATRMFVVFHGEVRETPLDRDVVGRAMLGAS